MRLIDADALKTALTAAVTKEVVYSINEGVAVAKLIDAAPTIDAVPARHGVEHLERERDALLQELREAVRISGCCIQCVHDKPLNEERCGGDCDECEEKCECFSCEGGVNYEWNGGQMKR